MATALIVLGFLQTAPQKPPPEAWKGWREGVWVRVRLAGGGCGCGIAGSYTRTMTGAEGTDILIFTVYDEGTRATTDERLPVAGLLPSLPSDGLETKKVREETLAIGKYKVTCEVREITLGTDLIRQWVPTKGTFPQPILRIEGRSVGTVFSLKTVNLEEHRKVGAFNVRCQVQELTVTDERGSARTRRMWLSRDVPGGLVQMEEASSGGGGSMEMVDFGTAK